MLFVVLLLVNKGAVLTQQPLKQALPAGQAFPQLPQLLAFESKLTQAPLQHVVPTGQTEPHCPQLRFVSSDDCPSGHRHWPLTQFCPFWQILPQAPQFRSVLREVQERSPYRSEQQAWPALQQAPSQQT